MLRVTAAQAVLGSGVVVALTFASERLHLNVATTAMLDLIAVVLLSLSCNFVSSIIVACIAAASIHFFVVEPRESWSAAAVLDVVSLIAFVLTALVITRLLSRVRASLDEAETARAELRLALDTVPALVWTTLPDGTGQLSNARWLEFTGLSSNEAQGWGYSSALHPEDYERLLPKWTVSFRSGEPIEDEARLRSADGSYRWFLHRAVPLRDGRGNIVKWYGTSFDIEDRKRAKEQLRERARLLDLTHDTVFVRDLNDVITYWNRGAEERYGWTSQEAVGQITHQLLETVFPAPVEEIAATLLSTGRWEGELIHTTRDRRRLVVSSRWSLQRDAEGSPLATLETNNDITERKRAEAALRLSEAYLAEAQRLSYTGSFGWDVTSGELTWSAETYRIFDYDPATTTPALELALRRVHPDDLAAVQQLVDRVTREAVDWELDYRLLMPDGSVKYVHVVARAARHENGNLEYVGAIQDVTAARRAQEELRRSEAYLAEAQRLSHTGSWAADLRDPTKNYTSPEVYRILGMDPVEGAGPPGFRLEDRVHPDDWPGLVQAVECSVRNNTDFDAEPRVVRPDGSIRHVYVVGHPVPDRAGEVVELVGTVMDVTERRQAEQALRRARERTLKARFAAALDERTRLAREIHDTLLQGFTGIALKLVAATSRVTGPPEVIAALGDVITLAQKTLIDARRAVWDLRSPSSAEAEFTSTIRTAAEDSTRGTGLTLKYDVEGDPRPLDPDIEATCVRVTQEAIANVVKHAAASTVRVRVVFGERLVRLSITDDGRGFEMDPNLHAFGGHWGLLGMRERASQIRGRLRVRSAPGQGTQVVLWAPYVLPSRARRLSPVPTA